ncbi:hypothetical protein HB364_03605 [Pseudoflavitalea sp. X16]|uniref:hypothetical protein n=1 Tax=Paraflavitalea devenefica TaxID=2716334 RepID=UPI00141F7446|nr:hypothetical protein [Paraflavitalea devenefica]NII24146.1 hypothetical protein [Paraflavitalea devenefica]
MKCLRYILVLVLLGFLVSCYEVNEEIVINEDGSGTYLTKMDMGQLLEMMQSFAGEEELSKEGLDKGIDTVIRLKDMLDSAKDMTAEQKALMANGTMKMQMDIKRKLFKMDLNFPYSGYDNLQKLMAGQGNSGAGLADVFKRFFGGDKNPATDTSLIIDEAKEPDMQDIANIYDVTVKNGLISKKINNEKFKALTARPEMAQIKQLSTSGMEILYTTTIKLPRPVKKADNPLITLSADKKTATMRYNLLELLETPDKFSYTLEY